jgi:hypothetical protein
MAAGRVQIDYDVVHLRISLVQLFVLLQLNFQEVVQIIELRRFGGAPNSYPFAALAAAQALPPFPCTQTPSLVRCAHADYTYK